MKVVVALLVAGCRSGSAPIAVQHAAPAPATTCGSLGAKPAADTVLAQLEVAYARWDAAVDAPANQLRDDKRTLDCLIATLEPFGGEYAMAAELRRGDVLFGYVLRLGPAQLVGDMVHDAKRDWIDVVERAKAAGVANRCSHLAYEDLAREYPSEYAPFHREIVDGTDAP